MSHEVRLNDYPLTCNKEKIEAEYNAAARIAGRQEGSSGLGKKIRWNNLATPLESREAAEKWIDDHDNGWYDQLAVTYYDYGNIESSAKFRDLEKRLHTEWEKVKKKKSELYPATLTSEFIGCKDCGSRLKRVLLKKNVCPVCGADLRPETTLKSIRSSVEKVKQLKKEYVLYEKKLEERKKKKASVRWLVKVEWHE